jgi:hypothetical protein
MTTRPWQKRVLHIMEAKKKRKKGIQEGLRQDIAHKDISPVNYFLQLGSTSYHSTPSNNITIF